MRKSYIITISVKNSITEQAGFTLVEILVAIVLFPVMVIGMASGFDGVRKSYTTARQLNEMYAVLSACPEMDRALEYESINSTTDCYPNNTFNAEGGSGIQIVYTPTLTVTDTSALPSSDPLQAIPDSKVVKISLGYLQGSAPPLELRMLITRHGIGQL